MLLTVYAVVQGGFLVVSPPRRAAASRLQTSKWGRDDTEEKIAECKSVLRKADDSSLVLYSLKSMDKLTRKKWRSPGFDHDNASKGMLASLNGSWRLFFVTVDLGNAIEYLPRSIEVEQTFDTTAMLIENTIYLGKVPVIRWSGSFAFQNREIKSDFDKLSVLDLEIDLKNDNETLTRSRMPTTTTWDQKKQIWVLRPWRWLKQKLRRDVVQGLSGTWDIAFSAGQKNTEKKRIIEDLLRLTKIAKINGAIRMEQTFDPLEIPMGIRCDVYVGEFLLVSLFGSLSSGQLLLGNVNLDFFRVKVLGVGFDLVRRRRTGVAFTCIDADENIVVTRDDDGGFGLWKRIV